MIKTSLVGYNMRWTVGPGFGSVEKRKKQKSMQIKKWTTHRVDVEGYVASGALLAGRLPHNGALHGVREAHDVVTPMPAESTKNA